MTRICIIFAGREDRMSILMYYINQALYQNKLDEVHLWDYTRKESDSLWIDTLKTDKIKVFKPDRTKIDFNCNGTMYKVDNFSLVWKEYLDEKYANDSFLKLDDDIVYLDIDRLDELFIFVEKNDTLWTTPIVVNNSLTLNTTNFMDVIQCGDTVIDILNDHKCAELMHEVFVSNRMRSTIFTPIQVKQYNPFSPRMPKIISDNKMIPVGDRIGMCTGGVYMGYIQINTLFFNKHLLNYVREIFKTNEHFVDEPMFNYPYIKDCVHNPVIYPAIVTAHLSFMSQDSEIDTERILSMYKSLIPP